MSPAEMLPEQSMNNSRCPVCFLNGVGFAGREIVVGQLAIVVKGQVVRHGIPGTQTIHNGLARVAGRVRLEVEQADAVESLAPEIIGLHEFGYPVVDHFLREGFVDLRRVLLQARDAPVQIRQLQERRVRDLSHRNGALLQLAQRFLGDLRAGCQRHQRLEHVTVLLPVRRVGGLLDPEGPHVVKHRLSLRQVQQRLLLGRGLEAARLVSEREVARAEQNQPEDRLVLFVFADRRGLDPLDQARVQPQRVRPNETLLIQFNFQVAFKNVAERAHERLVPVRLKPLGQARLQRREQAAERLADGALRGGDSGVVQRTRGRRCRRVHAFSCLMRNCSWCLAAVSVWQRGPPTGSPSASDIRRRMPPI